MGGAVPATSPLLQIRSEIALAGPRMGRMKLCVRHCPKRGRGFGADRCQRPVWQCANGAILSRRGQGGRVGAGRAPWSNHVVGVRHAFGTERGSAKAPVDDRGLVELASRAARRKPPSLDRLEAGQPACPEILNNCEGHSLTEKGSRRRPGAAWAGASLGPVSRGAVRPGRRDALRAPCGRARR